jgi:DNA-binding NtrC family response regulator
MVTILIVDDDAVIRGLLFDLLSEQYECNTASTAEEALTFLEFENYDVVVTDIAMPGLDGIDLLKRVQQKNPKTPVILISGKGNEHDADSFIEMGAFAYVTKPFKLDQIEEVIWRAVASTS